MRRVNDQRNIKVNLKKNAMNTSIRIGIRIYGIEYEE
jgi:hypothetical protein